MITRTPGEQSYEKDLERELLLGSCMGALDRLRNFPLYVPRQDLTRYLTRYELFKKVLGVQGSIIECGVHRGGGLMWWAQLSAILEPFNHQRRVIGFDTFAGLTGVTDADGSARESDLSTDSEDEIRACVELFDRNRPVGHIPKVELVRGDARETIPAYVKAHPELLISLLVLDFDIYEPTRAALECLKPRVCQGGYVALDEANNPDWPGETVAVLDRLIDRSCSSDSAGAPHLERLPWGSTMCWWRV